MMSAGTGITHSEYNPSSTESNHFLQVWIEPSVRRVRPRYRDSRVTADQKLNRWKKIAGPDGSDASVALHQDATIYATRLEAGQSLDSQSPLEIDRGCGVVPRRVPGRQPGRRSRHARSLGA